MGFKIGGGDSQHQTQHMQPEIVTLSIPFISGAVLGVILTVLAIRPHIRERLKQREKATWAEAMRFYSRKEIEHLNKSI